MEGEEEMRVALAGMAMIGILSSTRTKDEDVGKLSYAYAEHVARDSVLLADKLLFALKHRGVMSS
jgi:hypothetical protein